MKDKEPEEEKKGKPAAGKVCLPRRNVKTEADKQKRPIDELKNGNGTNSRDGTPSAPAKSSKSCYHRWGRADVIDKKKKV